MKKIIQTVAILIPILLLSGCASSLKAFAKTVEAGGTAQKEIDAELDGWNTHIKYHSKPVFFVPAVTNSDSLIITPETTLKAQKPSR